MFTKISFVMKCNAIYRSHQIYCQSLHPFRHAHTHSHSYFTLLYHPAFTPPSNMPKVLNDLCWIWMDSTHLTYTHIRRFHDRFTIGAFLTILLYVRQQTHILLTYVWCVCVHDRSEQHPYRANNYCYYYWCVTIRWQIIGVYLV